MDHQKDKPSIATKQSSPKAETPEVDPAERITQLRAKAQSRKSNLVDQLALGTTKLSTLQDRLYRLIDYAIHRYDWYDELCHRFLNIGIGLATATAGVAAVLVQFAIPASLLAIIFLWSSLASLFFTGLALIWIYNRGLARNYPYRKIADITSWYFIYNFPQRMKIRLSRRTKVAFVQVQLIADALEAFLERWKETVSDDRGFIKEDLEQVFILQLLQRYKNQHVRSMSRFLSVGFIVAGLLLAISAGIYLIDTHGVKARLEEVLEDSHGAEVPETHRNSGGSSRALASDEGVTSPLPQEATTPETPQEEPP